MEDISSLLGPIPGRTKSMNQIEFDDDILQKSMNKAYENSCPFRIRKTERYLPWWNLPLEYLKKYTRRLFNNIKKNVDSVLYKETLTRCNNEIQNAVMD